MVIDLRKCVGCQTCTIACKIENAVPPQIFWRRVVDVETGEYPHVQRLFLPMACMHCSDPPCLEVCPTTATYRREDGIVDINYDLCIGCGYCVVACPYLARTLIEENTPYFGEEAGFIPPEMVMYDGNRTGVCTKCTFCLPRIDAAQQNGQQPGVDPEATPACVASCIANAMYFGDLDDPESQVSKLVRENYTMRILEEMGLDPAVYYIVDHTVIQQEVDESTFAVTGLRTAPLDDYEHSQEAVPSLVVEGSAER
jgi:phenylacetyl-CoA:acceptor oxidoreductase subunit 1